MKTSNVEPTGRIPAAITRGYKRPKRSSNDLLITDESGTEVLANSVHLVGLTLTEGDEDQAIIAAGAGGPSIDDLPTTETDTTLRLAPDGVGGVEWAVTDAVLPYNGGEEWVASLGNLGTTEAIDLATGNWQRGTLNADCTFTFSGATNGKGCSFTLFLTEDGTGGWDPTWPGSVVWIGGTAPTHDSTASTTSIYVFLSYDGGSVWYGAQAGGGGSAETGHYEVLMTGASPAEPLEDGSGTDWLYVLVS